MLNDIDWSLYPNFKPEEFRCRHTGIDGIRMEMLELLQSIRDVTGKPIFISSGYRHHTHPVEVIKDKPGEHTYGMAVDIICHGEQALVLLDVALEFGVTRIGIHQKGDITGGRFIHLGIGNQLTNDFPAAIWTY